MLLEPISHQTPLEMDDFLNDSIDSDINSSNISSVKQDFNYQIFQSVSKEMLRIMFENMRSEEVIMRKERLEKITLPFAATPTSVVQLIFFICEKMQQPPEVRYLTVEIYDRFINNQFLDLVPFIWPDKRQTTFDNNQWKLVSERIRDQALLRVTTCIALASKFISHDRRVSMKKIQEFLCNCGHAFSLKSLISSEMRVYKILNYKLHFPNRQAHAQILIEMVFLPDSINKKLLHRLSFKVIDVTYLYHQEIFHKLFFYATGCWEKTSGERKEFLATELNNIYIATAIVLTTFSFAYPLQNAISEQLATSLDFITDIPSNDIVSLSKVITMVVLQN